MNRIDTAEMRYFLAGNTAVEMAEPNPDESEDSWMEDAVWKDLLGLQDALPRLAWVTKDVKENLSTYRKIFESGNPRQEIRNHLAERLQDAFQELVILRCMRPDKVVNELQMYIAEEMGAQFVDPPTFNLQKSFDVSTCETPILFVLTSGADPMTVLLRLADEMGMNNSQKLFSISLGQGQGPRAENAISIAKDKGTWVVLQNCDLSESWLPTLEKLCEEISVENTHENFRLWLTSMPCPAFPVSVLQNGVKMTLEPPRGMRQSLLGSYSAMKPEWLEDFSGRKSKEFKKLVFGLCFFHATVGERIKFGPLGWNIPYGFSVPDLSISLDQLKLFVEEYDEIPYKMLNYCAGQCNYGGRVTDDKDRRCITNILTDFFTSEIMDDSYRFSASGTFYAPPEGPHSAYVEFIRELPIAEGPECYGLHDNAAITSSILETRKLLGTALSLLPRSSGGGAKSWAEQLAETAEIVEGQMPEIFDLEKICIQYPTMYEDSSNTILTQELERFNKLLSRIKTTLKNIQRALRGEVVMSGELEAMGTSLVNGRVPKLWSSVAYPSLKPLGPWVTDFLQRITFLSDWVENNKPKVYWLSGFFFTQSFLTGIRQNYARKTGIAIDLLGYDFQIFKHGAESTIEDHPETGAYANGLFIQGCTWSEEADGCEGGGNFKAGALVLSKPRELFVAMPMFWILVATSAEVPARHTYTCPLYKTSERRGQLSTTGHSTNYVMAIELPMQEQDTEKMWVKSGVAMLTQLDS